VLLNAAATRMGDSALGQIAAGFLDPRLLAAFLIGFVAGYLIYGAIFLAFGALCESIQEAQTALGAATLIMAMPMMLIAPALDNPNAPLIEAVSWVPLFTPFMLRVMMLQARIFPRLVRRIAIRTSRPRPGTASRG